MTTFTNANSNACRTWKPSNFLNPASVPVAAEAQECRSASSPPQFMGPTAKWRQNNIKEWLSLRVQVPLKPKKNKPQEKLEVDNTQTKRQLILGKRAASSPQCQPRGEPSCVTATLELSAELWSTGTQCPWMVMAMGPEQKLRNTNEKKSKWEETLNPASTPDYSLKEIPNAEEVSGSFARLREASSRLTSSTEIGIGFSLPIMAACFQVYRVKLIQQKPKCFVSVQSRLFEESSWRVFTFVSDV